jgi:hypothetical protein
MCILVLKEDIYIFLIINIIIIIIIIIIINNVMSGLACMHLD